MASDILKSSLSGLFGEATPRNISEVVSGSLAGPASSGAVADQFKQLTQQIQQLQTISQTETQTLQENTQAVNQNTTQLGQSGASTASKVGSTLQSTLGLFTGLSPLITGLLHLFGGGGDNHAQTVTSTTFSLPPSVSVNGGVSEAAPGRAFGVNYAAGGQARADTTPAAAPQITVQVQALDSQSILDRSQDIAAAVRQAMLESNVLSDVIQEAVNG